MEKPCMIRMLSEQDPVSVYEYTDQTGQPGKYGDWCIDMIKHL